MKLKFLEDGTCKTFSVNDSEDWVMRQSMPGMLAETGYDFVWYQFTDDGWVSVSKVSGKDASEQHKYEAVYQKALVTPAVTQLQLKALRQRLNEGIEKAIKAIEAFEKEASKKK